MQWVLVNGVPVIADGVSTNALPAGLRGQVPGDALIMSSDCLNELRAGRRVACVAPSEGGRFQSYKGLRPCRRPARRLLLMGELYRGFCATALNVHYAGAALRHAPQ